jgi:signal transduction histidine kinase
MEAFSAMVSHDLKQPLGSVQAALKIIKVKPGFMDDSDQTIFELINNTTKRMNL